MGSYLNDQESQINAERRFWRSVSKTSGCWIWNGIIIARGYGRITVKLNGVHKQVATHRFSWSLKNGPIPEGMFICHKCDNPPCVNPDHLFLGTHADNMRDCVAKRRNVFGERNPCSVLKERDVRKIRKLRSAGIETKELAKQFKVHPTTIRKIVRRVLWGFVSDKTKEDE